MRIALFTDTAPPTVNGVARAMGLLVDHAAAAGHEVALITPRLSQTPYPGARIHVQLPGPPVPVYPELRAARPWLGRAANRALEAFRPDVVHAATEASVGFTGRRWALRRGVPLVTSYCTNFPEYLGGYGLAFAEGACWGWLRRFHAPAALTFCPSRATLEELRRRGFHDRLRIWSRGVDGTLFHPERRDLAVRRELAPDADVVLLYVGRVAPEKKIDLLFRALPLVRERTALRVALVVVGGGPALERFRRERPPGVALVGYRRGIDLAAAYASADVFVFPSDTETFGQVVTEALASGLPVVAPARGGVVDTVIPGRTGRLFTPGDPASLADEIVGLLEDPAGRAAMGVRGRASVEGRTWFSVFRALFAHYAEACRSRYPTVTGSPQAGAGNAATFRGEDGP